MRRACSRGSAERQTDIHIDAQTHTRLAPQYLLRSLSDTANVTNETLAAVARVSRV